MAVSANPPDAPENILCWRFAIPSCVDFSLFSVYLHYHRNRKEKHPRLHKETDIA